MFSLVQVKFTINPSLMSNGTLPDIYIFSTSDEYSKVNFDQGFDSSYLLRMNNLFINANGTNIRLPPSVVGTMKVTMSNGMLVMKNLTVLYENLTAFLVSLYVQLI